MLDNEQNEAREAGEAPAQVITEPEHANGNGVVAASDDPQNEGDEKTAAGKPPSPPFALISAKVVDLFEERFPSGDAGEGSRTPAAEPPGELFDPEKEISGEAPELTHVSSDTSAESGEQRRHKQSRRFLNLSGPALSLWLKARDDLAVVGIQQEQMDDAARLAVQNAEIPGVLADAEKVESRDRVLVGDLMVVAFARTFGRHVSLHAFTGTDSEEAAPLPVSAETNVVKGIGMIAGLPTAAELEAEESARKADLAAKKAARQMIENWQTASSTSARKSMMEIARLINRKAHKKYADQIETGIEKMVEEIEQAEMPQSAKDAICFAAMQALLLGVERTRNARVYVTRIAEMLGIIEETPSSPTQTGVVALPRELEDGSREGYTFESTLGEFSTRVIDMLLRFSNEVDQYDGVKGVTC